MKIIGITGHRNLKETCMGYYKEQVSNMLKKLKREYNDILVLSSIADGADRLVVYEAMKLNIPFKVILPMDKKLYEIDFDSSTMQEFEYLIKCANEVVTIPLQKTNSIKLISQYNQFRDMQYEAAGHYVANNSDVLIALWDGKYIGLTGGTGEIVKYYKQKDKYKLYHLNVSRNKDVTDTMVEFKLYENSS